MRRSLMPIALAATLLIPASTAAQGSRTILVPALRGIPRRELTEDLSVSDTLGFKPAAIFAALQTVYDKLKVKMDLLNAPGLQLGNPSFFNRGSFAGRRMSAYLNCGNGFTGPHADNYRVYLSLISFVDPLARDSSLVRTLFVGQAVNVTEGNRPIQECTTTGELEKRMIEMLRAKLTEIQ